MRIAIEYSPIVENASREHGDYLASGGMPSNSDHACVEMFSIRAYW